MMMDEEKLEELKQETVVDNSELEELMKQDITPKMQKEVLEILKESRLYLPVDFGNVESLDFDNVKPGDEIEGPSGFNIQFLTDHEGRKAVPLFTSDEMMRKAGARTSAMVIYTSDLADMLKQSDRYSIITINPFTEFDLNMPIEAFLSLFDTEPVIDNDELKELLSKKEMSDELTEKLQDSIMITGCVDTDDGTNFVLIWDSENTSFLPLFTDISEFKKIFENYKEDVYPQAYHFTDLIKVSGDNVVINPASESLILDMSMFRRDDD